MNNLFRNFTHTFGRFKVASTLNFAGLVVALSAFFIFYTKVEENLDYNTCFDDWQQMYRIEMSGRIFGQDSSHIANIVAPMVEVALTQDHVTDAVTMPLTDYDVSFFEGDEFITTCPYISGYGKFMNFWRKGIVPDTLIATKGVLVPRSFAMNKFGTADIVGKDVEWEFQGNKVSLKVLNVYDDFPKNCCVRNAIYRYEANSDSASYANFNYHVYVKLDSPKYIKEVEKGLKDKYVAGFKQFYGNDEEDKNIQDLKTLRIHLRPIRETYFSNVDEVWDRGDRNVIAILFISAILVLVITNVNLMNFSLAEAPFRIRNINIRRVFGAKRWTLMQEMILEGVSMSLIAFCISMLCMYGMDGVMVGNINPLDHLQAAMFTLLAAIIVGYVSSAYPAYFATSFAPAMAMKGMRDVPIRSKRMRNLRISFQMVISFVAMELFLMCFIQAVFIFCSNYGFEKDYVLYGTLNSNEAMNKRDLLRDEIESMEGVQSVSYSRFALGTEDRYMMWSYPKAKSNETVLLTVLPVDYKYMQTLGIKINKGRRFNRNDSLGAFIVNEAAVRKYPWIKVGKGMMIDEEEDIMNVVGVCDNIKFSSLRKDDTENPLAIMCVNNDTLTGLYYNMSDVINIRISSDADVAETKDAVKKRYAELFPKDSKLQLLTLDDSMQKLYRDEFVFMAHTLLFALLYIFITMIGVSCTIMFESEFHRKEIGIRRVFGASKWDITFFKFHLYVFLITLAFILSIPLAHFASHTVLKDFSMVCPYLWIAYPLSYVLMQIIGYSIIAIQRYMYGVEKPSKIIYSE